MEKGTQHSPPLDSTPLVVSRRDVYFVENVAVEPTSCQAERARAATTLFLLFFSWRSGLCQISMLQITPPSEKEPSWRPMERVRRVGRSAASIDLREQSRGLDAVGLLMVEPAQQYS